MSHDTHINKSCHTYEGVFSHMSHVGMGHVTHINESWHTYEGVMSFTTGHTYEGVMSHGTRMKESRHIAHICSHMTHVTYHTHTHTRISSV